MMGVEELAYRRSARGCRFGFVIKRIDELIVQCRGMGLVTPCLNTSRSI